jgi:hypothetical protein
MTVVHPGAPPPPQWQHEGASPVVDACSSAPRGGSMGGDADLAALAVFPLFTPSVLVVFLLFHLLERYVSVELFGC